MQIILKQTLYSSYVSTEIRIIGTRVIIPNKFDFCREFTDLYLQLVSC